MDHNLGSSPPSGTEENQEGAPKKKTKKRNTNGKTKARAKGNGKTTEVGDETGWLRQLSGLSEAKIKLMEERDAALLRCRKLEEELKQRKKLGLDDARARVKLMSLFSFFSRMVNFQARCDADKRKIDKMVSEVQAVMRSDIERVSK